MKMIAVWVIFVAIVVGLISLWTDRNLDFYLSLMKGETVDVPYWMSLLLTIVINGVAVVANIIAEIIRLTL